MGIRIRTNILCRPNDGNIFLGRKRRRKFIRLLSYNIYTLIEKFYKFNKDIKDIKDILNGYSMEQRWLMFIMYELYGLNWQTNKWKKD